MDARTLRREAAQAEKRGDTDKAVRLFVQAGAHSDAARLLVARGDFSGAGRVLFRAVGVSMQRLKDATTQQKTLATKAAICLARGGETQHAVALFTAVGDLRRAAETLERAGDAAGAARLKAQQQGDPDAARASGGGQVARSEAFVKAQRCEQTGDLKGALALFVQARAYADAGRLARTLGKVERAGELYEEGGHHFEAAVCWHEAKNDRRCLDALVRLSRDDPRYRAACMKAIALVIQIGELSFELDQFIARFVASGPESMDEANALYALGRLYARLGFPDNAMECFRKVAQRFSSHAAAGALSQLQQDSRGSAMAFERIVREEASFRGSRPTELTHSSGASSVPVVQAELMELPELPPLPGAAQAGPRAAKAAAVEPQPPPQAAKPPPEKAPEPVAEPVQEAQVTGTLELNPGSLIADRYRLVRQIGQGGTASVFRATDLELEEEVAIKVFTVAVDDPDLIRRFKQELSLTRRLSHPNIVRLHDIGTHRGFRFLTMEILQGQDLSGLLASDPPGMTQALDYLVQACRGLDLAHQHGIVHRDIKPENFFVTTKRVLKVMDFGIAKKAEAQKRTQAGFIAGTPPYMSPEQINGFADVTHLADVYSLGVVAYEMFAGQLPFMHDELMPLLMMHISEEPRPPKEHNPRIPGPLNALILNLLEKTPDRRVQSLAQLAETLQKLRPLVTAAEAKK